MLEVGELDFRGIVKESLIDEKGEMDTMHSGFVIRKR